MANGNIPDDAKEGSLGNLSSMLYYLKLSESADPNDYSINQVQKYLAKEYIDNVFSKRRAITNRIYSDVDTTNKAREERITTVPNPTTAAADDDFGFTTTIEHFEDSKTYDTGRDEDN